MGHFLVLALLIAGVLALIMLPIVWVQSWLAERNDGRPDIKQTPAGDLTPEERQRWALNGGAFLLMILVLLIVLLVI
jgi:ABC-type Fe3+ transport system permease subunit